MRLNKSHIEQISLLWILISYQMPNVLCASLQNNSLKTFSDVHEDSNTFNLSDLIEYSPLKFPVVGENISISDQKVNEETTPEIITLKLKTHLIIHNKDSNEHSSNKANEKIKIIAPNVSESSLSDIEYIDPSDDFDFWRWTANKRSRKLNYVNEESNVKENTTESNSASEKDDFKSIEEIYESEDSEENKINEEINRSEYATGRQFLFHPYLPYHNPFAKNTNSDEKISFDDILPVKMVKFIKSMVEEAPWEQMFMKMVRMIVDQFVDKIIEKMFADKEHDDHFKKRSFEVVLTPTLVLPTFQTPVIRLKRAVVSDITNDQDDDIFSFLPPKRDEQDVASEKKKSAEEKKSWLDHFLDYVFPPNSKMDVLDEDSLDRLRKRDTTNTHFLKNLLTFFLNTFEKSSGIISDAKDVLRYKMLKEFLPYLYQKRYTNNAFDSSSNSVDGMRMTHRKSHNNIIKRNDHYENLSSTSRRIKRSTRDLRTDDEDRLWQAHSRRQRPLNHRSHDQCSLRKACNAGRLLSRIPSVQEITLQLRSSGNEPHWDALIWGMKKKRCSRVLCKRQRSPKGSRYSWSDETPRFPKKDEMVTEPPVEESDFSNNLNA